MSGRMCMAVVAVLVAYGPGRGEPVPDAKKLSELVAQLGSREFRDREKAAKALVVVGRPALEYLHQAMASADAEIRRRAALVAEQIEKKLETDRLLQPHKVHLAYRETPAIDAVADFAKKSGFPVQFEGDRVRLANQKITLDTGEVTFWEALDQFCRATGLSERRGPPPTNQANSSVTPQEMERRLWERRMLIRRGLTVPPSKIDFGKLVLVPGKADLVPTFQKGAVRIRVLPPTTPIPGHARTRQETAIVLEVMPEPSLDWRGVVETRIERAIDSQGREVSQILDPVPPPSDLDVLSRGIAFNVRMAGNNLVFTGDVDNSGNPASPPCREIPIRLKLHSPETKMLREVCGTLFAQIQTPHEPLIRVEKPLQGEGKTFQGPERSYLKVHEAQAGEHGQIKMRITIRSPSMSDDAMGMMQGAIFVRRFNGRMAFMAEQDPDNAATQNLSLQDAKGQAFHLTSAEETTQANWPEVTQEFRLVFQSKQGLGEPARLIYSGHRLLTLEIPFVLTNVPLPE